MPISLDERLLTLSEAAEQIPGGVHLSTLHRWRTRGVRGHVLETLRIGGKRVTSIEALQRFADSLSAADGAPPTTSAATSRGRARQIDQAVRDLDVLLHGNGDPMQRTRSSQAK